MKKQIVVICGPTASGKTALSIALAKAFNGEVVSADSMQIYRRMDIGTAKPTLEERDGVPHHMLDVAEPGESYSVSRYAEEASACVEDILARGKLPIVCGGTGLYIDGLIRGTDFQPAGTDSGLREQLEGEWETQGAEAMMARLAAVDPDSAARLHLSDKRRILRALEVYLATGETITVHNARSKAVPPRYEALMIGLNTEPRQILYDRIDRRVDVMLEQGLLQEVRSLLEDGLLEGTAAQAIGYKELLAHFRGEMPLEQAADLIRQKSRNYAKRQLTWFRRDERVKWIVYNAPEAAQAVLQEATEYLTRNLYNGGVKS
ncbi:MAG: tRNA (adenosine(37)-N6)-dimethylallyltransferase MiaA [Clostridia bacterium]|nr:tRNA (adenosine(37)-N6)-dimethylallyltransferase MiaA [Clostridia bacterium]